MPRCPNTSCQAELTHLAYSENISGNEWGSVNLPTHQGDYEMEDREVTDGYDTEYNCPHCDYALSSNEVERINQEFQNSRPTRGNNRTGYHTFRPPAYQTPQTEPIEPAVECPHCHHVYNDALTHEMICPRCNKPWSPPEKEIQNIEINITNNNNP